MKNKTFVLDIATWRCGGSKSNDNALGEGCTLLLNEQGYMCCLGQFSKQLGVTIQDIYNRASPDAIDREEPIPLLTKKDGNSIVITTFSEQAIEINDYGNTTPIEKIKKLRALLNKRGYKLEIKNKRLLKKWEPKKK